VLIESNNYKDCKVSMALKFNKPYSKTEDYCKGGITLDNLPYLITVTIAWIIVIVIGVIVYKFFRKHGK